MLAFRTTISGLDLEFEMIESVDECFYMVTVENIFFAMRMDDNAVWRITDEVPVWIKDIEYELGCAIEVRNA